MKGVFEMPDLDGIGENYCHNVETDTLQRHIGASGEVFGSPGEVLFLEPVHIAYGGSEVVIGAGLHFYDDQRFAFAGDNIEFAGTGGRAEVARHNGHAQALQVAMGEIFTATSKGLLWRPGLLAETVAQGVRDLIQPLIELQASIRLPCRGSRSRGSVPRICGRGANG